MRPVLASQKGKREEKRPVLASQDPKKEGKRPILASRDPMVGGGRGGGLPSISLGWVGGTNSGIYTLPPTLGRCFRPVHASHPHHAGPVPADELLGMTGLAEGFQVVGMVPGRVPKGVFLEVSVIKGGLHGAIPEGFTSPDSSEKKRPLKVLTRLPRLRARMAGYSRYTLVYRGFWAIIPGYSWFILDIPG